MPELEDRLIGDTEVAAYLGVSRSWVRQQRFSRKHANPHSFEVDAVYIGSMPRYRLSTVKAWAEGLRPSTPTSRPTLPKKDRKAA